METIKNKSSSSKYLSSEYVQSIISKNGDNCTDTIESYDIQNASDKMLGFLCDYWKLKVNLTPSKKVLHYFLKLISVSNEAKAKMVEEQMFFAKELYFYSVIKERIQVPGKYIPKCFNYSPSLQIQYYLLFQEICK